MTPCLLYPAVLTDLDLLRDLETAASADPDTLTGTPCCPGVVEGAVRVVNTIDETQVIISCTQLVFVHCTCIMHVLLDLQ